MSPHFYTRLELRPAAHGQGVFALDPIAPGGSILRFGGELFTRLEEIEDRHHFIQIGPGRFLGPSGEMDDYINHSCQPNCGLRLKGQEMRLVALEPIGCGEELTFDYATCLGPDDPAVMPCDCGKPACRKVVSALSLSEEQLRRYQELDVLPDFVARAVRSH